jgi:hypothetical protein
MKKVKVLFELICFVLGPAITAYSIFDFRVGPSRRFGDDAYPYYYYTDESQVAIAVGVALICLGIVLRS